jgi:ThiF family
MEDCHLSSTNFVRRQEYIRNDDARYLAGIEIENRIEPPPIELSGDSLDRQRCIFDFDQNLIEKQDCLVLGAGGIGQNVGLTLARVGVRSIKFVDNDIYEASNLSRQLLGSRQNIGQRKVDVAVEGVLNFHNISSTKAVGFHLDALISWHDVVSIARCSSVIYNCIDVGAVFDFAVNSLSKALSIPLVQGQSAGWSLNAEFYTGQPGLLCGFCSSSIVSSFAIQGVPFKAIEGRLADFLRANALAAVPADIDLDTLEISEETMCLFLKGDKQYRVEGPTALILVRDAMHATIDKSNEGGLNCLDGTQSPQGHILFRNFETFLAQYYRLSLQCLLPDQICSLKDILFIPRPRGIPTRYIGSWVCPCLTVAAIMVSQWVNHLTGPTSKDPPASFQLSLASCRTDICDTAIECGFVDPPTQSSNASEQSCVVCAVVAKKLSEQLYFSLVELSLSPHTGRVYEWIKKDDSPKVGQCQGPVPLPSPGSEVSPIKIRRGSLWYNIDHLGPEYVTLALDAIPCHVRNEEGDLYEVSQCTTVGRSGSGAMPGLLKMPLCKGQGSPADPTGEQTCVPAFGSGQRSAVIRGSDGSEGTWYRLKGCGMPGVGFTVEDALDDNNQPVRVPSIGASSVQRDSVEEDYTTIKKIRGSAYEHTCAIELEMSAAVDAALRQVGMVCANRPVGKWEYISSVSSTGSAVSTGQFDYPLVARSCAIFETLGDRRLSDHVLRGLELLLPLVATEDCTRASALRALESARAIDLEIVGPLDAEGKEGGGGAFDVEECDEYDERLTRSILLYNGGANSPIDLFADLTSPSYRLEGVKIPLCSQFPSGAPKKLKCIWDQCCATLAAPSSLSPGDDPCHLAYLYWRLGRECGTVGRALKLNNIMWGAYTDTTGRHMNAHGNNFVLLRESVGRGKFLAPLDFDMSYTRDNCYFGE